MACSRGKAGADDFAFADVRALAAMLYFAPLPMMRSIVASGTWGGARCSAYVGDAQRSRLGLVRLAGAQLYAHGVCQAGMLIEAAYIGVFIGTRANERPFRVHPRRRDWVVVVRCRALCDTCPVDWLGDAVSKGS